MHYENNYATRSFLDWFWLRPSVSVNGYSLRAWFADTFGSALNLSHGHLLSAAHRVPEDRDLTEVPSATNNVKALSSWGSILRPCWDWLTKLAQWGLKVLDLYTKSSGLTGQELCNMLYRYC